MTFLDPSPRPGEFTGYGESHLLPRSALVLVLLGGARLGGVEGAVCRPSRVRLEDRPDDARGLPRFSQPVRVVENSIGDRAVFSGIVKAAPLAAAIDALMADEAAYASWRAHFGDAPTS